MSAKGERRERLAKALGLTVDELRTLRRQIFVAESNLLGIAKSEKVALVARRLSITPIELGAIRATLADQGSTKSAAARVIADHIVHLSAPQGTVRRAAPKPPQPNPGPSVLGTRRAGATRKVFHDWNADTNVFVTIWGNAVHMYADCSGMRGFRHVGEPDPIVDQARLRDPVCRDRRACRKCFDFWSASAIDGLDDLLEDLHGHRRPLSVIARSRSAPAGHQSTSPIRVRSTASPSAPGASKSERDRAAAGKLLISVQSSRRGGGRRTKPPGIARGGSGRVS